MPMFPGIQTSERCALCRKFLFILGGALVCTRCDALPGGAKN